MTQLELRPQPRNPIARTDDPETSHRAAEAVISSGKRDRQASEVLRLLRIHPGVTSAELAQRTYVGRYVTARRLPELERLGRVKRGAPRACATTGKSAVTWWPA